jgi:mono/diheme cytochrome c family protein
LGHIEAVRFAAEGILDKVTRTLLLAVALAGARPGLATVALQEEATKAGYPAQNCSYCHSFDSDHMKARALQLGISTHNCVACHGGKLPRKGPALFNPRGRWLLEEKARQKAERVDVTWLKAYVAPAATPKPR